MLGDLLRTEKIRVGKENIIYRTFGTGRPTLFLHGFATAPFVYEETLRLLKEEDREIIAPRLFGINYLHNQPTNMSEYADITKELLLRWQPELIIGHSYGATIGSLLDKKHLTPLVMMNPVLPTNYGPKGFFRKAIEKTFQETEKDFGLRSKRIALQRTMPFIFNHVKKFQTANKAIEDLCAYELNHEVYRPVVLLEGTADLYFPWTQENKDAIEKKFHNSTIEELNNLPHDWPIFFPGLAKGLVKKYFP